MTLHSHSGTQLRGKNADSFVYLKKKKKKKEERRKKEEKQTPVNKAMEETI